MNKEVLKNIKIKKNKPYKTYTASINRKYINPGFQTFGNLPILAIFKLFHNIKTYKQEIKKLITNN